MARHTVDGLVARVRASSSRAGVRAVLLFGIPDEKDEEATGAWDDDGIVQQALRALRPRAPRARARHRRLPLRVHDPRPLRRAPRRRGRQRRDASSCSRARPSSHVEAGRRRRRAERHDGRPRRRDPRRARPTRRSSATPRSTPPRSTARSARRPTRRRPFGDRRELPDGPRQRPRGLRECELDLAEGADMLMVKPALPYLDVIRAVRDRFDVPVAAYNVSGEYAMVKAAAQRATSTSAQAALESLTAIQRAGADLDRHLLDEGPRRVAVTTRVELCGSEPRSSSPAASTRRCARCGRSGSTSRCSSRAARARTSRTSTASATSTGSCPGAR